MSEAAASAPVVATPAAAPAPVAAPAADTRGASKSFAEEMAQFGGFDGQGEVSETPKPSAPPTKAKGKAKTKTEAPAAAAALAPPTPVALPTPAERRAALVEIAQELGLEVDDARVTTRERAEFREARREQTERMKRDEATFLERLNGLKAETTGDVQWARQLKQLHASGDYEGLARHLGAKDWNGLQDDVMARISDPNYKRLRELEDFQQNQLKQQEQRDRQAQQQAAAAQQQAARKNYISSLSAHCAKSSDPLVAAMHDDPMFLQAIYNVQQENYDGRNTVTPEQAIKIVSKSSKAPLMQELQGIYARLSKAFGAAPPPAALAAAKTEAAAAVAAVVPAAVEGKKNRTAVVPSNATPEASVPRKLTRKELDAEFSRQIKEAIADDNRLS